MDRSAGMCGYDFVSQGLDQRANLGDFLQSRRARLRPQDVDLVSYGERRRVPGLRREELAQLAGVSVSYYTRLEQGQSQNASEAVLDAIARALRLDEHERAHLGDLARPARTRRRPHRMEHARPGVRRLLDAMDGVPALVLGRGTDVLAWNAMGHALFAGHIEPDSPAEPTRRPNMTRMVFLDPHTRELYVDWKAKARSAVAHLRMAAGRNPDDERLNCLIGELTVKSAEFAALWRSHPVRTCAPETKQLRHPLIGALTVRQENLTMPDDPEQLLVTVTTAPGSPSEAGLRLLGTLVGTEQRAGGYSRSASRTAST
jgi:transcriptional regulator with XRE-family HTH domain